MSEQVSDGHRQVMIGAHQSARLRNDAMPVKIGIVAERDIEPVFQPDKTCHGVRRRAIHADFAVPVERHERKGRVEDRIDHLDVEPVPVRNRLPVRRPRPAHGVGPDLQTGGRNGFHVQNMREVLHIRRHEVDFPGRACLAGLHDRRALDALQAGFKEFVRPILDLPGRCSVSRAARRRIVLDPPVLRGIMGRGDDYAVRQTACAACVVPENSMRQHRCGRAGLPLFHVHGHPIGRKHFEGRRKGRFRQGVGIHANQERAIDPVCGAHLGNGLAYRSDVVVVERPPGRRAAMPRCAERNALPRFQGIRPDRKIGGDQPRNVDDEIGGNRLPCKGMMRHDPVEHIASGIGSAGHKVRQCRLSGGTRSPFPNV